MSGWGDAPWGEFTWPGIDLPVAVDLKTRTGSAVASDVPLAAFRVVWSIDGPGSFEGEVPEDDVADWLPGQRRILVRSAAGDQWQGWLTTLAESTSSFDDLARPRGPLLRVSGLGLASVLARRVVHGDFSKTGTVATTIAWNLIQHAQAQTNGDYGFTLGAVDGTAPARARDYCDGDVVADAINDLAGMDPGGFDWEIDAAGRVNMWVEGRGGSSGQTLARTGTATWDVTGDTTDLATYATVLGDADQPCGAPLAIASHGAESTYGRLEITMDMASADSAEMFALGDEELRSRVAGRFRVRTSWPLAKAPWTWGAVWLGDTLSVTLPAHFGGTQTMRAIEIALSMEPPDFGFIEYEFETTI